MTKEKSTKIVNFMTPEAGILLLGHDHIVNKQISSPISVYDGVLIRQIKYIVMMTKEGSSKILNFMTLGTGDLMFGHGCRIHYSEYALFSTLSWCC